MRDLPLPLVVCALVAVLILSLTLAVTIGPVNLTMLTVWRIALAKLVGGVRAAISTGEKGMHIEFDLDE